PRYAALRAHTRYAASGTPAPVPRDTRAPSRPPQLPHQCALVPTGTNPETRAPRPQSGALSSQPRPQTPSAVPTIPPTPPRDPAPHTATPRAPAAAPDRR